MAWLPAHSRRNHHHAIDAPGAGTAAGQGIFAANLNPSLAIAGNVIDASNVSHSLIRVGHGTITTLDNPGAGTGVGQDTFPFFNNSAGAITGYYILLIIGCSPITSLLDKIDFDC